MYSGDKDRSQITPLINSISLLALALMFKELMVCQLTIIMIAGQKAGTGRTDGNGTGPSVGVYGSNPNLAQNGQKIDLTSKFMFFRIIHRIKI